MVNNIIKSPFIIDTAGTIELTRKLNIIKAEWVAPTTQGHELTLTDGNDRPIFTGTADSVGANTRDDVNARGVFTGLKVSVIDSGVLYIYFEWR